MRKSKLVVIPSPTDGSTNRDAGKAFLVTEMDSVRAEKWAIRALLAVTSSGVDIPPEVAQMGAGALMAAGFRALLTMAFADAEPLLDEMMNCVVIVPDPKRPDTTRPIDDVDIEEVMTRLHLRSEVVELHTGFSVAAFLSRLGTVAMNTTRDTPAPPTSQEPSQP